MTTTTTMTLTTTAPSSIMTKDNLSQAVKPAMAVGMAICILLAFLRGEDNAKALADSSGVDDHDYNHDNDNDDNCNTDKGVELLPDLGRRS